MPFFIIFQPVLKLQKVDRLILVFRLLVLVYGIFFLNLLPRGLYYGLAVQNNLIIMGFLCLKSILLLILLLVETYLLLILKVASSFLFIVLPYNISIGTVEFATACQRQTWGALYIDFIEVIDLNLVL